MKKPFENIVRNEEDDVNQHFLRFSLCFLPYWKDNLYVEFELLAAIAFNLDKAKVLTSNKELIYTAKKESPANLLKLISATTFIKSLKI